MSTESFMRELAKPIPNTEDPIILHGITGKVKWFNESKGYGFVFVEGQADVLLHIDVLKKYGLDTVLYGAHIVFDAVEKKNGLQVYRIVSIDNSKSAVNEEAKKSASRLSTPLANITRNWVYVNVKWFNRIRGFGFFNCDEVEDIFVHMENLRKVGILDLKPGQKLYAKFGHDDKMRYRATEVSLNPRKN